MHEGETFYDRFNRPSRYNRGVMAANATFFQLLEWTLIVGALRYIGERFDSLGVAVVAGAATIALGGHLSILIWHAAVSFFPSFRRRSMLIPLFFGVLACALFVFAFNEVVTGVIATS